MGVDYYQCARCFTGGRDDDDYHVYCECGNCFCTKSCGELINHAEWVQETDDRDEDFIKPNPLEPTTCVICRNEVYTDKTLLEAVMKHYNITRDQVVNIWRKNVRKNKS